MRDGRVRRAYLGVAGGARPLPPVVGQRQGIEITSVVSGSPADVAGMRPGDVLLSLDGVATARVTDLQRLMTNQRIDRPVEATVWRDGRRVSLTVRAAELSD
jgi:S1-C subfamily serine protease